MRQSREYQLKMDLKPNMLVLIYMGKCTSFMRYTYKSTFCLKSTLYPKHKRYVTYIIYLHTMNKVMKLNWFSRRSNKLL